MGYLVGPFPCGLPVWRYVVGEGEREREDGMLWSGSVGGCGEGEETTSAMACILRFVSLSTFLPPTEVQRFLHSPLLLFFYISSHSFSPFSHSGVLIYHLSDIIWIVTWRIIFQSSSEQLLRRSTLTSIFPTSQPFEFPPSQRREVRYLSISSR